jgi:hypothetical protein
MRNSIMQFSILFSLLLPGSVFANIDQFFSSNEADKLCQKGISVSGGITRINFRFVVADDNNAYFTYSKNGNSTIIKRSFDGLSDTTYNIEGHIRNIQFNESEIMILTNNELYVLDKVSNDLMFKTRTLPGNMTYSKYAFAYGVYKFEEIYYIAHGKYGLVPYDSKLRKHLPALKPSVPQPITGLISMITDIVGIGETVYLPYDDYSLSRQGKAFEGLMIFNLRTMKMIKTIPVKQSREAYYMSNLTIDGDELVIANLHLNFRHKLSRLMSDRWMRPLKRIWKYPHGNLMGRGQVQNKTIYGCFNKRDTGVVTAGQFSLK